MGMIERIFSMVFGDGGRTVKNTVELFRENAEAAGTRDAQMYAKAMSQFSHEFERPRQGWFDRLMDAANRLPRPALALGTLGLFISAMVDPVWFASRMQGIALVPEPLWWLLGAIVSFYFGARHQSKSQEFQRQITRSLSAVPVVMDNLDTLGKMAARDDGIGAAATGNDAELGLASTAPEANPALRAWQRGADIGR